MRTLLSSILSLIIVIFLSIGVQAQSQRNVELILDASGSMNGRLSTGEAKISAAKRAVSDLIGKLPTDINLAFRAYGHQYHRSSNNCTDTALLVPFSTSPSSREEIRKSTNKLKAQGYTPITYVLGLAADDLKPLAGTKTIVLVSDGKETCEGDPCLVARKMAEANADLVIHTVGFGVSAETRSQLQCIANVARGKYFDADDADQLAASMEEATVKEVVLPEEDKASETTVTVVIKKPKFGFLKVENGSYHKVFDAESGKATGAVTASGDLTIKLEPGIYNVQFGKGLMWKSVLVTGGETTVLKAGILKISNNQYHSIRDPETGKAYRNYSSSDKQVPLPPGRYDIGFDKAVWRGVEIREGETTVLDPGILRIENNQYHPLFDPESGKRLITYSTNTRYLALPPGRYLVGFDKARWPIEIAAGEELALKPGVLKINNNQYHKIIDPRTGKHVITYSNNTRQLVLPPGNYVAMFGKIKWPVLLEEGEKRVLNPGVLKIDNNQYHGIVDPESNKNLVTYSNSTRSLTLPPGRYAATFGKVSWPFEVKEGEITRLKPGGIKVTPATYAGIYRAGGKERIGKVTGSGGAMMLPPGDYEVNIDKQRVKVNVKESQIVNIKVE